MQWTPILIGGAGLLAVGLLVWGIGLPDSQGPDQSVQQPVWHANGTVTYTDRFCGDCHYGLLEFWSAHWEAGGPGWNLTIAPAYPEAPLHAVQVLEGDDAEPVIWESGATEWDWIQGQTWTMEFDVPDGAGGIFVRVHGESPLPSETDVLETRANDYVTSMALQSPDGELVQAAGPEPDLKLLTTRQPAPGTWTLQANLLGGDAPRARGVAFIEVLAGTVTPLLNGTDDWVQYAFPAGPDGQPPNVTVRLQPHHDHTPYQHTDWDRYDSSPFVITYAAAAGPAPRQPSWNASAIATIWGDQAEHVVLERTGRFLDAYAQEPDHNDPGFGSSYPSFGPTGKPVWPGTATVRFEVTWTGDDDAPMAIKFSPHSTPYFFEPREVERGPGRAVWEMPVQPAWWEDPNQTRIHGHGGEHGEPTSNWDIAPYLAHEDGELVIGDIEWTMVVTGLLG